MKFSIKSLGFVLLFLALTAIALNVNVFQMQGANKPFTGFEFIGALPGAFLGSVFGIIAVLGSLVISGLLNGNLFGSLGNNFVFGATGLFFLSLLFTKLFSTIYFAKYKNAKLLSLIPILCMVAFILTPAGKGAWIYSLYWLIPAIIVFLLPEHLFLRSLGATFTAHALGSVAFIYTIGYTNPASFWLALIPVVAMERVVYAIGISVSFVAITNILTHLFPANWKFLNIEKKYVLQ